MTTLRWCLLVPLVVVGCDRAPTSQPSTGDREATSRPSVEGAVTVYCSVDREFAEPILAEFEKRSGIKVHRIYDTEAGKTTGLLNRLIAEKARPRADVWWSSEIFGTIQLAEQGLFAAYRPPSAADIPEQYKDATGRWTAFGLRGRVLAYDPAKIKKEDVPRHWLDLAFAKYKGRVAIADPRFGTTRGHMAAMLWVNGVERMTQFFEGLRANGCRLADGNSQSVLLLTRGTVAFASTDTDDVAAARARGESIKPAHPMLGLFEDDPRGQATLWIPCSVAVIQAGPHADNAKSLVDYLVSAEVEEKLAVSDSQNVPVRIDLINKLNITQPAMVNVDYTAIAKKLDESDQLIRDILLK